MDSLGEAMSKRGASTAAAAARDTDANTTRGTAAWPLTSSLVARLDTIPLLDSYGLSLFTSCGYSNS
jgi:hypothetical protein